MTIIYRGGSHCVSLGPDQDPVKSLPLLSQRGNYTGIPRAHKTCQWQLVRELGYFKDTIIIPTLLHPKNILRVGGCISIYIYTLINLEYVRYVYTSHTSYMYNVSNGTKVCSIPPLFFLLSSRGFGIPRPLHNQRITIYSTLQPHPNWYKQYPTKCTRQQYLQNKRYQKCYVWLNTLLPIKVGHTCKIA